MTLSELQQMRENGLFHHATYRDFGTVWEGLWIYARDLNDFRGYKAAGCFAKDSPDLHAAEAIARGSGISVGAYGQG